MRRFTAAYQSTWCTSNLSANIKHHGLVVHGTFLGLSTHPGLAPFRNGMALFLHRAFQPYILKAKPEHQRKLLAGFKAAVTGLEALDRT